MRDDGTWLELNPKPSFNSKLEVSWFCPLTQPQLECNQRQLESSVKWLLLERWWIPRAHKLELHWLWENEAYSGWDTCQTIVPSCQKESLPNTFVNLQETDSPKERHESRISHGTFLNKYALYWQSALLTFLSVSNWMEP